jgi:hypothetical protein
MQLKSYNRVQLQEFIDSGFYKNLNQIPISEHRAVSHIHNPDAQDDDELLWAAFDENCLVGYVGVLPAYIHVNQERKKIYWLSCFWVDEQFRKSNVASLLFFPVIKRYKDQLVISNFDLNLEKTYQSLGIFKPTIYKWGSRFYCKSCFGDILPVRFPKIRFLKPLLSFADLLLNAILSLRFVFYRKVRKEITQSSQSSDVNFDAEFEDFIQNFYQKNDFIERFSAHFDWILNYPWVLQGKPDNESKKYYFSSKSEQFCYNSVKFYKNNQLCAFLLLKIRDRKLTVSYVFADDNMADDMASYILKKTLDEKLTMITCFDERISKKIRKNRIGYLFERLCKQAYILSKTQDITPDTFQEGDGDNVFT